MPLNNQKTFEVFDTNKKTNVDIACLSRYCESLDNDKYVAEGYRFKQIARYKIKHNQPIRTPHDPLFQSKDFNPVHGDIVRHYNEIDRNIALEANLTQLVSCYFSESQLPDDREILLQMQRVTCNTDLAGQPAIEGWHRDGKEIVGMVCLSRENINGGISQLRVNENEPIVFEKTLNPGEMLLIDDRKLLHFVTPIKPSASNKPGYRDIILISTPSSRPPKRNA